MIIEHYKPEPVPAENFNFTISAGGHAFCDPEWCASDEAPWCSRLYYVLDGMGEIYTEQGTEYLTPGRLYLIPVGFPHSYNCKDHMEKLYFFVQLDNKYGTEVLRGVDRILSVEMPIEHMRELLELHKGESVVGSGQLQAMLQLDIFNLLAKHNIEIKNRRLSDVIQRALSFIENNLSASLTVKTVADNTFISSANLSHKFKAEMGISVSQYIDGMVMYQAEQLLINTEWPLSKISTELGFYDQFYFSRRFKEKHTISPLKYRKSHRVSKASQESEI